MQSLIKLNNKWQHITSYATSYIVMYIALHLQMQFLSWAKNIVILESPSAMTVPAFTSSAINWSTYCKYGTVFKVVLHLMLEISLFSVLKLKLGPHGICTYKNQQKFPQNSMVVIHKVHTSLLCSLIGFKYYLPIIVQYLQLCLTHFFTIFK